MCKCSNMNQNHEKYQTLPLEQINNTNQCKIIVNKSSTSLDHASDVKFCILRLSEHNCCEYISYRIIASKMKRHFRANLCISRIQRIFFLRLMIYSIFCINSSSPYFYHLFFSIDAYLNSFMYVSE